MILNYGVSRDYIFVSAIACMGYYWNSTCQKYEKKTIKLFLKKLAFKQVEMEINVTSLDARKYFVHACNVHRCAYKYFLSQYLNVLSWLIEHFSHTYIGNDCPMTK